MTNAQQMHSRRMLEVAVSSAQDDRFAYEEHDIVWITCPCEPGCVDNPNCGCDDECTCGCDEHEE